MHIRPVQPTDYAEWLRMRLNLWGGTAEEHTHDIDDYFAIPQSGVACVVERTGGGVCGCIEVSLRNYAEGCQTSPIAYLEGWYVDASSSLQDDPSDASASTRPQRAAATHAPQW